MTKLRSNHNRTKNPFVGMTLRVILMMVLLAILFYFLYQFFIGQRAPSYHESTEEVFFEQYDREHLLPAGVESQIVHHRYYSLGYSEKHEQALWVCYVLNKDELRVPNVPRYNRFEIDPKVRSQSAEYYDYRGSGYSRGHLAPAGDMAFNELAMRESFYMSNMSPQKIPFNGGIWRELEESVRDWAYKNEHLYVITGPLLTGRSYEKIGKNKVSVPEYFYKAVMDIDGDDKKSIAFIMPNAVSDRPIMEYAVSINELEESLGFDIFPLLLNNDQLEEKLESNFNVTKWPVSQKRFQNRVDHWNKQ